MPGELGNHDESFMVGHYERRYPVQTEPGSGTEDVREKLKRKALKLLLKMKSTKGVNPDAEPQENADGSYGDSEEDVDRAKGDVRSIL